jgi:hypothetical protein
MSCNAINDPLVLVHAKTSPRQSSGQIILGRPFSGCFLRSKQDVPGGTKGVYESKTGANIPQRK